MANPIWDPGGANLALTCSGAWEDFSPPWARLTTASLPGVDGVFVSRYGLGGRHIAGGGFVATSGASHVAALAALRNGVRQIQAAINSEPASYTDATGTTHENCVLLSYEAAGRPQHSAGGESPCVVRMAVRFTILQQEP